MEWSARLPRKKLSCVRFSGFPCASFEYELWTQKLRVFGLLAHSSILCLFSFIKQMAPTSSLAKKLRMPSFFKVMVGDFTKRVKIPREFIKHFKGENPPSKSVLRGANLKSWQVEMIKSADDFFFQLGWSGFVKDNSLEIGDFVIFHCDDKLNFDVAVLGHDGCEKEVTEDRKQLKEKKESGKEPSPSLCRCKYIPGVANGETASEDAGKGLSFDAGSCPFKLSNPHFVSVLKAGQISRIRIPKVFGRETGLQPGSGNKACIRNTIGKSWPVNIIIHDKRANRGAFARGWSEVVKGNQLVDGDVCIFEFISKGNSKKPNLVLLHVRRKGTLTGV